MVGCPSCRLTTWLVLLGGRRLTLAVARLSKDSHLVRGLQFSLSKVNLPTTNLGVGSFVNKFLGDGRVNICHEAKATTLTTNRVSYNLSLFDSSELLKVLEEVCVCKGIV